MVNFNIDISETEIIGYDKYLLDSLLIDRSKSLFYNKTCNIIWATDNYSPLGEGFKIDDPILSNNIINEYGLIIRPRVKKQKLSKLLELEIKLKFLHLHGYVINKIIQQMKIGLEKNFYLIKK